MIITDSSGRVIGKYEYEYDSDGYNTHMHYEGDKNIVFSSPINGNENDLLRNYLLLDENVEYDENHSIIKVEKEQDSKYDGIYEYKEHIVDMFSCYPDSRSYFAFDGEYWNDQGIKYSERHMVNGVTVDGWYRRDYINFAGNKETEIETESNDRVVSTEVWEYDHSDILVHKRVIEESVIVSEYERSYIYDDELYIEEKEIQMIEDGTYDKTVTRKNEDGLVLWIKKGNCYRDDDDWIADDFLEYYYSDNEITGSYHIIHDDEGIKYKERKYFYPGGEKLKEHTVYNRYDEYNKSITIKYDENGEPTEETVIYTYKDGSRLEEQYIYTDGEKELYQTITRDVNGNWTYSGG